MILDRLIESVMDKYGIETEDIEKVKKIIFQTRGKEQWLKDT